METEDVRETIRVGIALLLIPFATLVLVAGEILKTLNLVANVQSSWPVDLAGVVGVVLLLSATGYVLVSLLLTR